MIRVDDPADQNHSLPEDNAYDKPMMADGQVVNKSFQLTVGTASLSETGGFVAPTTILGAAVVALVAAAGILVRRRA